MLDFRHILLSLALASPAFGETAAGRVGVQMHEVAHIAGPATLGDVAAIEGVDNALLARHLLTAETGTASVDDVVRTLSEAGVRPDRIFVAGPVACRIETTAAHAAPSRAADDEWAEMAPAAGVFIEEPTPDLSVADELRAHVAVALGLDAAAVRIELPDSLPSDARLVELPPAKLGRLSLRVADAGVVRPVNAVVRAEVEQLVAARPVRRGQTLRPDDLRREMCVVEQLGDLPDPLAVVGQSVRRPLSPGDPITADALAARLLVERGQLLTVEHKAGGVVVRTLARSNGDAAFGQTVRAVCQSTGRELRVRLAGPQRGSVLD